MSDPNTCWHRIVFAAATHGADVMYVCASCQTELPDNFWAGRQFKYDANHENWVQVGRTELPETDHEGTPRWEFEQQFGPITAEQWQWLKEFCQRNPVTGGRNANICVAEGCYGQQPDCGFVCRSRVERSQAPADPGD